MSNLPPQIKVSKIISATKDTSSSHHVGSPPTSFVNPWPSVQHLSPSDFLKARFGYDDFKPVPSSDKLVNVRKPDWGISKKGLKITWLGHATVLVETQSAAGVSRGVRVLFDPVFSERTSPVSFAGPKRYVPKPCELDELPDVDIVAISHDHYDHMDSDTLVRLYKRQHGNIHFLVGLRNASRLRGFGIGADSITELDWWERVRLDIAGIGDVSMTCTPSQHSSGRGLFDRAATLWCSWTLESHENPTHDMISGVQKVFFAGDTGYRAVPKGANESDVPCCPAFKEIGERFGPFDLSLLPIGLYSPRHLLSTVHCTPEDALCLHKDLKSQKSVGMHYGTFRGGISQYYEEVTEPPKRFKEACENDGKMWGTDLALIDIGETLVI